MLNPKYEYGTQVRLNCNIRNDGSFGDNLKGKCLMRRGSVGYVRDAGLFLQEHVVYQVHFIEHNQIIGCKESELILASEPWTDNAFEYGDRVALTLPLTMAEQRIAEAGDPVMIIAVQRENEGETQKILYRIQINEHDVMVPERALAALEVEAV